MNLKSLISVIRFGTSLCISEEYGSEEVYFNKEWTSKDASRNFPDNVLNADVTSVFTNGDILQVKVISED